MSIGTLLREMVARTAIPSPADPKWHHVWSQRVMDQGGNRLQVSTFLVGFSLAAFAALQIPAAVDTSDAHGACPLWAEPCFGAHSGPALWSLLLVDGFLGTASLLFLASALMTYRGMLKIAYASDTTVDAKAIRLGYQSYHTGGKLIEVGVYALIICLIIIGARMSFLVTAIMIVVALAVYAVTSAWARAEMILKGKGVAPDGATPETKPGAACAQLPHDQTVGQAGTIQGP